MLQNLTVINGSLVYSRHFKIGGITPAQRNGGNMRVAQKMR